MDDFPAFRQLAQVVGFTTLLWSQIERQLDNWVLITFNRCGGRTLESELPRSLSKKVDYLKRAFRRLAPIKPFESEALGLLDRVNVMTDIRHPFTHASLESLEPESGTVFTFRHLIHEKQAHRVEVKKFDLNDWPPIETELMALHRETGDLAKRLLETFRTP